MLDSRLPFPESFEIPQTTVDAIARAKNRGGRVIAVGTSVLRALEGSASSPTGLRAGKGCTDLVVGPGYHRKIVDGILSGIHIPGETHFELLRCFIPAERLTEGTSLADQAGFTSHEFGESTLILPASPTDAA
jgi:S-adenosylmethionine:tRNA ribosyltransferase-isomerase